MMHPFRAQRRAALIISLGITALIALTDSLLMSYHSAGSGQRVISFLNAMSWILQFPGFLFVQNTGLRVGHHTTTPVWIVIVLSNWVMWMVGLRLLFALIWPGRVVEDNSTETLGQDAQATEGGDAAPEKTDGLTRRRFLTGSARLAVAGAGAVGAYSVVFESRHFQVTRRTFAMKDLPPELHGLRLVQLTDIHHGPVIPMSYVRSVIETTNALRPDLVLLTGDYVHRSARYIDPVVRAFADLRASVGVVGVLGNHDWWEDGPLTQRAFASNGIPLIDNTRLFVTPDRTLSQTPADRGLCLAGVGDYIEDRQDYAAALGNLPPDMPRLLLSHNPDVAEDTRILGPGSPRVDLMLAGHTHGGQVRLPFVGTLIVPSDHGQKYASGLVRGPAFDVFVSRGIGMTVFPIRLGVPPEIAVIELQPA